MKKKLFLFALFWGLYIGVVIAVTPFRPVPISQELQETMKQKIVEDFPKDLYDDLSVDVLNVFRQLRDEKWTMTVENLDNLYKMLQPHLGIRDMGFSINVSVVNEKGEAIKGASVCLWQTSSFSDAREFYVEHSDNHVPYKKEETTGKGGVCVFPNIKAFNSFWLCWQLFAPGVERRAPNLRLRVKADGYEQSEQELFNINRKTIALAAETFALIMWQHRDDPESYFRSWKSNRAKPSRPEKSLKFPETHHLRPENFRPDLEIRVVLNPQRV